MSVEDESLILIVDDIPASLKLLGNTLRDSGYRIAAAIEGSQAIEFALKRKPDLIILDIVMPTMNGLEICRRLKDEPDTRDIPILFVTALTDAEDILRAFETGGVDYITKPFIKEVLLARLKLHLTLKKTIEKLEKESITDKMTRVYNRRFAYQTLEREIMIANREHKPFSLCYIDIDHLKQINAEYGYKAGDQTILSVVEALRQGIRKTDYIFRMSGDEFMLLFPGAREEEMSQLIARISLQLKNRDVQGFPIGFSFGLAQFGPGGTASIEDLIQTADGNMRSKKRKEC